MNGTADHYSVYYADKLWNLLPATYRAQDTDQFGAAGPLREMVNRIGAQAAIIRRSLDRMWDDQSIETCDDWVIPYIGDLLATNLVANLDARSQRLDVAKTIYYRLRKGTSAILEEIAADITGWEAKVVEFFRRMGRTRHGLDPAIGLSQTSDETTLQLAEGLIGPLTRTGIGGSADLRNVYGASRAHSAFDEFYHIADVRVGQGRFGWYNVPRLGVFLWRLTSFGAGPVTPLPVHGCPGWFTFDPTGRDIPLFAAGRSEDAYGDQWVSPAEAQLPTPISQALLDANEPALYPGSIAVFSGAPSSLSTGLVPSSHLNLRPERGRFQLIGSPPSEAVVNYHYGFSSEIGAGPYDRRIGGDSTPTPAPAIGISGGGKALVVAGAVPSTGTLTLTDSLTYSGVADTPVKGALTIRAANNQRPLVRLASTEAPWTFKGPSNASPPVGPSGSSLVLDGLFISGGDIVLQGNFQSVTINCSTLDPGSAAGAAEGPDDLALSSPLAVPVFDMAADLRDLVPTNLWIEGTVTTLTIDRSILGPIRTRSGGTVETLAVSNSILQAIPSSGSSTIELGDVKDPDRLEERLKAGADPVSAELLRLSPSIGVLLGGHGSPPSPFSPPSGGILAALLGLINKIAAGPSIYDPQVFSGVPLATATLDLLALPSSPHEPEQNRKLLEDAFPLELADAALALADGTVAISRCTVLGRVIAHRFQASECILQDLAQVDDTQDGCVRFTAWAEGSVLPRKYESVQIQQGAPLFTSTEFGQPGYGQLLPLVDAAILPLTDASGNPQNTISAGAQDGSEMGAFARDKNPIKERGLLVKYQEFMPATLVPVVIYVT
jgi:hypothetical protein